MCYSNAKMSNAEPVLKEFTIQPAQQSEQRHGEADGWGK